MSEEIIPDVQNLASDVEKNLEPVSEEVVELVEIEALEPEETEEAEAVKYSEKTLAELIAACEDIAKNEERMKMDKEVKALKAAFYKRLIKDKIEAGENALEDAFTKIENSFKDFYANYKQERAEYNAKMEKERAENLAGKEAVIEDLKALCEKDEDVNATFNEFREIQNRWKAIGAVPAQKFRDINETYQVHVERFYDKVKIHRELRDLDFKKNLEVKEKFCEMAEKLAENENVVAAFKELQKLHEQWKEYGPVAKQYRDEIWERFKAATAVINKKYQAYFEGLKEQHAANLEAKTALCEKAEEVAAREIASSNDWNTASKEIEEIQKEWRKIGFASRKDNQKIYDRFRAICDGFYGRKRDFYSVYKDSINDNLEKKIALCEAAEQLKESREWKKATDKFIELQKQWKEIGAVPRKKSEQLWKRFRAACDEFFDERDKNAKENNFHANLKAKKQLIEEINAYQLSGDVAKDTAVLEEFMQRWQAIGFVPFKDKESITTAYKAAVRRFPDASKSARKVRNAGGKAPKSEKERLVQKYNRLEQDIVTYENNIGFFSMSKNSLPLLKQMEANIAQAKEELKALAAQIREIETKENNTDE